MHQRTILLIDDDKGWVGVMTRFLRQCGYRVLSAGTCAAGIKAVEEFHPDCVLLDFELPDKEGCEAALAIRKDAQLRKTPIIMATNDDTREEAACADYKVDAFYFKMWPLMRLKGMIEALLRRVDLERDNLASGDLRLDGARSAVFLGQTQLAELSRDQFRLLALLVAKTPEFVTEEELTVHLFGEGPEADKVDAIKMLAHRLRKSLGEEVGRRVNARAAAAGYTPPRKRAPPADRQPVPAAQQPRPRTHAGAFSCPAFSNASVTDKVQSLLYTFRVSMGWPGPLNARSKHQF